MLRLYRLLLPLALTVLGLLLPVPSIAHDREAAVVAPPADAPAVASPGEPALGPDGVYVPPALDPSGPVPVLVAFHGFSGSGPGIAARLRACADQYGWVLVAPTMAYRDYFDPTQLRDDARENLPRVRAMLDALRLEARGVELQRTLLLYGFSRGAQMAARFSLAYPSEVAAVATLAGGSYTLPEHANAAAEPLRFPFGIADLSQMGMGAFDASAFAQIPFWVGVGADDTNPADTARAWDAHEGQTRVDRARAFTAHLRDRGNAVQLQVFSGASHEETAAMRQSACAFLAASVHW